MTDLTPDARAILDAGRDLDAAGDLEKARVRRALFAKVAAGGAVLAAASTAAADGGAVAGGATASGATASGATASGATATTGAAAGGAFAAAKILIPLAVIVGGGAGGFVAWRAQRAMAPAPTPVVVPAPAPVAPPPPPVIAPVIEPTPAPAPAPVAHPAPAHHAHAAAPAHADAAPAPTNRLAEETALLAAANGELRRGDAHGALSLLDDYDRRYPSGVLREEVLATRVIARCQLGAAPDKVARRGASAFLARHPSSPLAPRVRSSCGE